MSLRSLKPETFDLREKSRVLFVVEIKKKKKTSSINPHACSEKRNKRKCLCGVQRKLDDHERLKLTVF